MVGLLRLGLIAGLVATFSALGPAWPSPAEHPLAVAPLAGLLAATVATGSWVAVAVALSVLVAAAAVVGGAPVEWAVVALPPVAATAVARLRHGWRGVASTPIADGIDVLGIATGAALLAAALTGALALPTSWALAVGLGVLAAMPSVAGLLAFLTPRPVPLPAPIEVALPQAEPPAADARPAGKRVLVVEDDAVNRLVAQEILRAAGHEVVTAADGLEGLSRVTTAEVPFDAVLLDLHMPGLDGSDVLQRIRTLADRSRATVPVLLLSADVTPSARARGMAAGADAFLTKPIEAEKLLAALASPARRMPEPAPAPPIVLSEEAAVDLDLLEGRLGDLGRDSLGRILGLFQDAAPRHLARLREHAGRGDVTALRREAHTLKGAAAVIGATRVCTAASDIEKAAGDPERVAATLARLESVIDGTLAAVAAFAQSRDVPAARRAGTPQETSGANT